MATVDIKVPSPGESISEVRIAQWLVKSGDTVEKDQVIAEIDSDKATLELSAEAEGRIELLAAADATVNVGDVVAKIDTSVKAEVKPKAQVQAQEAKKPAAAPPPRPPPPLLLLLRQPRTLHRWPRPCLMRKAWMPAR